MWGVSLPWHRFSSSSCPQFANFSHENWTSELRELAGYPPFCGVSPADFVYHDVDGRLTRQLLPNEPALEGATPEYFIEVKSTSGTQDNSFYTSLSQLQTVRSV